MPFAVRRHAYLGGSDLRPSGPSACRRPVPPHSRSPSAAGGPVRQKQHGTASNGLDLIRWPVHPRTKLCPMSRTHGDEKRVGWMSLTRPWEIPMTSVGSHCWWATALADQRDLSTPHLLAHAGEPTNPGPPIDKPKSWSAPALDSWPCRCQRPPPRPWTAAYLAHRILVRGATPPEFDEPLWVSRSWRSAHVRRERAHCSVRVLAGGNLSPTGNMGQGSHGAGKRVSDSCERARAGSRDQPS